MSDSSGSGIPDSQREAASLLAHLTGDDAGDRIPVETHISAVFVGRDRAFKLKKAVALGFLDFTGLDERRRFCERELAINAANAPGIYRAVHAVTRDAGGGACLGGAGQVLDWVLEMAPLPSEDFLDAVAARGGLDEALLDGLGDAVAAMHAAAEASDTDAVGPLRRVLEGNLRAALDAGLPSSRVDALARLLRTRLSDLSPVLRLRAEDGRHRRCHGDLHLANLVLWSGRPVAFDALEFDEAMATIDTGYDLAFLLMDLEARVGRAAACRVLARYVARTGDAGLVAGLPFWLSMRALIRAHCEQRSGRDGARFLALAEASRPASAPRMVAVGGVMGTGKSRLARLVAPVLGVSPGALVLRSDEVRKRLAGVAPEVRLPPGGYGPAASAETHAELFRLARQATAAGHSVVVDAVFLDPAMRTGVEAAARDAGAAFTGFWLEAPVEVLRRRVATRRGDASDADEAVMRRAAATDPGDLGRWTRIDAAADPVPEVLALLGDGVR